MADAKTQVIIQMMFGAKTLTSPNTRITDTGDTRVTDTGDIRVTT